MKVYSSKQAILNYVKSDDYGNDICIGISITDCDSATGKWAYSLMYNITGTDRYQYNEVPSPLFSDVVVYKKEYFNVYYKQWYSSGFMTIQNWLGKHSKGKRPNLPHLPNVVLHASQTLLTDTHT